MEKVYNIIVMSMLDCVPRTIEESGNELKKRVTCMKKGSGREVVQSISLSNEIVFPCKEKGVHSLCADGLLGHEILKGIWDKHGGKPPFIRRVGDSRSNNYEIM